LERKSIIVMVYVPRAKIKVITRKAEENKFIRDAIDRENMKLTSKALNILTKYGVTADEAKSAAVSAFSERVKFVQELNSLAKEIRECEEKVELIKKLREVRPYHEEFKALEGRKKEKYKKDHSGSLQEYYDLTQEILKWYTNGHTPTAENLEKKIEVLTAQRSQKNAEYRAADQKARELSEASREIEEFLRQEQRRDQQKKRKEIGITLNNTAHCTGDFVILLRLAQE